MIPIESARFESGDAYVFLSNLDRIDDNIGFIEGSLIASIQNTSNFKTLQNIRTLGSVLNLLLKTLPVVFDFC